MAVHKRMTRSERAKQFMPFAALRGYEEALRRAEEEHRASREEEPSGEETERDGLSAGVLDSRAGRMDL